MKIRFKEDTNIRRTPDTSQPPLGVAFAGTELNVELAVPAGGASQWFCDPNGWYYWAGGTEIVTDLQPLPVLPPVVLPPVVPANRPPLPAVPAFPVALMEDDEPSAPDIPEGETRSLAAPRSGVPTSVLEALTSLPTSDPEGSDPTASRSAVSVNVLEVSLSTSELGGSSRSATVILEPDPPAIVAPPTSPGSPIAAPEKSDPLLKMDPPKLSWGVEQYGIEKEWWQNRQLTGRGVSIALLSTGILGNHPDLRNAIQGQANFTTENTENVEDLDGLGTQCAIIAAGQGQLAYGVAPEANLLIGLVGQYDRDITGSRLLAGLRWAISADADIIALLVDLHDLAEGEKLEWQATIQEALDRNIILLAPVGNSLERRPEVRYPAQLEGVISIGAHDQSGLRSAFSAKSYRLDVLAPGEGLLTSNLHLQPTTNLKSTAIATAYTAGLLALVRQWEAAHGRVQPPAAIRELLCRTAAPHKSITQGNDVEYGYGILNPSAILHQLENGQKN